MLMFFVFFLCFFVLANGDFIVKSKTRHVGFILIFDWVDCIIRQSKNTLLRKMKHEARFTYLSCTINKQ